jgi:hypothetical protein
MKYLILLFFIVSCSAQKSHNSAVSGPYNLELVLSDAYSNVATPQLLMIEEVSSLRAFFALVNKTRKPGLAFPKVDFTKERILIYACGEQYGATVPKLVILHEDSDEIVISCIQDQPLSTTTMTSPFAIYKINSRSKSIRFTIAD